MKNNTRRSALIALLCCAVITASCGKTAEVSKDDPGVRTSAGMNDTAQTTASPDGASVTFASSADASGEGTAVSDSGSSEAASVSSKAAETTAVQTAAAGPATKLPDGTTAAQTTAAQTDTTTATTTAATSATTTASSDTSSAANADPDSMISQAYDHMDANVPQYNLNEGADPLKLRALSDDQIGAGQSLWQSSGYNNLTNTLYDAPSESAAKVGTLRLCEEVTAYAYVINKSDNTCWYYVEYNGLFCWVESRYLQYWNPSTPLAEKLVLPEHYFDLSVYCDIEKRYLLGDDLVMRTGPSDSYEEVRTLSETTAVLFIGYSDPSSDWTFVMLENTGGMSVYGWVDNTNFYKAEEFSSLYYAKYGTEFVPPEPVRGGGKPVLYLYPEKVTDVSVKLTLNGCRFYTTYPKYNNGWNVTAYPGGRLVNKADGCSYDYLFWDTRDTNNYLFEKGFCVKGEDTEQFLRKTLKEIGLNEREMNEFIVYWLPQMEHNPYNLICFQTSEYEKTTKLSISPEPDSLLRVFMTYYSMDKPVKIAPQTFEGFERKGFTAVEWGGEFITGPF